MVNKTDTTKDLRLSNELRERASYMSDIGDKACLQDAANKFDAILLILRDIKEWERGARMGDAFKFGRKFFGMCIEDLSK